MLHNIFVIHTIKGEVIKCLETDLKNVIIKKYETTEFETICVLYICLSKWLANIQNTPDISSLVPPRFFLQYTKK